MTRVLQQLKEQSFWKRFAWQFPLMFVLFNVGNLIFDDEGGFNFNGIISSTGTAFFMAFYFSFQSHSHPVTPEDRLKTVDDLQQRKWRYYVGLYAFTTLLFFLALTVVLLIGLFIFIVIVQTKEEIWSITLKAYVVAAIMTAILVFISFIADRLELNRLRATS